jgi:hypothetical protein
MSIWFIIHYVPKEGKSIDSPSAAGEYELRIENNLNNWAYCAICGEGLLVENDEVCD